MDNWTVSDVTGHAGVIGQYLVFQINQSEDSSKITVMSNTTCGQLHQRPITSASNYNRITLCRLTRDTTEDPLNILSRKVLSWKVLISKLRSSSVHRSDSSQIICGAVFML